MRPVKNSITDIPGISVGHAQDYEAITGCTVILCEKGATSGVDQRGGAPGTRETDALRPMHLVEQAHAVVLAGGSAYGLDAASGVMKYLEEKNIGFNTGPAVVPIVASAVLFDLAVGDGKIRPDANMGYQACLNSQTGTIENGNVGAGTGATVGKIFGMNQAMKSGIGTSSIEIGNGIFVGAIIAVNAFGDIINPHDNQIVAGARTIQKGPVKIGSNNYFANTLEVMKSQIGKTIINFASSQNTVIGVVATNAKLNKEETNKIAQMAHNGLATTIRPAHTMFDGDTIFALATNEKKANVNIIGAFAAQAVEKAIINAVFSAKSLESLPAAHQESQ